MIRQETDPIGCITIPLDNNNIDSDLKGHFEGLLCRLLDIVVINGGIMDNRDKMMYRYIKTMIEYFLLDQAGRQKVQLGLSNLEDKVILDNRLCIAYKHKSSSSSSYSLGVIDKSIHNDIIGFMSYYYDEKSIEKGASQILYLNKIYVVKHERCQGIANSMINALKSSFIDKGIQPSPSFIKENDKYPLPIFKALVPCYIDNLKLFFHTGFQIIRLAQHIPLITREEIKTLNDEIKDLVNENDLPAILLSPRYQLFKYDVSLSDSLVINTSYMMVHILECCYMCRKKMIDNNLLFRCKTCQSVFYCSSLCQHRDWKRGHKFICNNTRL